MTQAIIQQNNSEVIEKLVLDGDLSKMQPSQKVQYYNQFCQSLGLNPLTQPFQIIKFQGKEKLYATKDCTEQLRKIHGVSITDVSSQNLGGVFVVTAKAMDKNGKTDASTGAVPIEGLKGEAMANALMKAETKAKRRVTLSICGLGLLDESEIDTMKGAETYDVHHEVVQTNTSNYQQAPKEIPADDFKPEAASKYGLQPEDMALWADSISQCRTIDELKALHNRERKVFEKYPPIHGMLTARRLQIESQSKAAA